MKSTYFFEEFFDVEGSTLGVCTARNEIYTVPTDLEIDDFHDFRGFGSKNLSKNARKNIVE